MQAPFNRRNIKYYARILFDHYCNDMYIFKNQHDKNQILNILFLEFDCDKYLFDTNRYLGIFSVFFFNE